MDLKFEVKSKNHQIMRVYEDRIELSNSKKGEFLRLEGTKTYYYVDITSIQFKNCGWTAGFFDFSFPGGREALSGALRGRTNENRFMFGASTIGKAKKIAKEMETVNQYIQQKLKEAKEKKYAPQTSVSSADELKKFKELLDMDVITQEEFDAKKKQLLGL